MELIYVQPDKCLGCRSCEIACRVAHSKDKNLVAAVSQSSPPQRRLFVEQQGGRTMPVLCRHCDDAPCVAACITGCLYKNDRGFVLRHKERCIGCWSCILACPFGVISRNAEQHLAVKCDRCHKKDVPACAAACPTKALRIVDVDELPKERRRDVALKNEPVPLFVVPT
ncbi:4Fe-4S dicluster domain-containing protein [Candidatus Electronema sp. JM]|uniref:4Fe-4S dicluster domain-containing protein n=1 Tax=Candidatus Electronema sp. JM TaxID=3401571 RepID=UPI003AA949E2